MTEDGRLAQIWAQLDLVMDPELDEPVTDMGFVEGVTADAAGGVDVTFRLPTYWCSPNFAFLMAQGIKREVEQLPWVVQARVHLQDHMSGAEMSAAVNSGGHFSDVFNELTKGEDLTALREKFDLKAFQRRQEVVIKALVAQGFATSALVGMPLSQLQRITLTDPEAAKQKQRYLTLLLAKRIAVDPADLALPTYQGAALTVEGFADHMALLRSVRINMEFSGSLCRGLKRNRYMELVPGADGLTLMDFMPSIDVGPPHTQAKHCG